ncbi:hypothetical protein WME98_37355 [Sorangium sp. So ce296]|uniref:hypothetical protein n=1 Tax=Sorangium sp. So ce296 TaxID=3133296 RepID=UPI003F610266
MGVHVILDIDPRGIDEAEWAAVYEETLALLSAWRPRLLGRGWRTIDGVRVPIYTRSLRGDVDEPKHAHWSVAGDRDSLRTAECQSFFRDLGVYAARRDACPDDDIVVTAAMPDRVGTGGPVRVFGGKTQGCPYHFALLAAAMLVEERFPRHAMVWGNIDREDAEEARRLSAPILGRELPLPVRVDGPRLIERLRARYEADALAGAFLRVFLGEVDEKLDAMLGAFPGEDGAREWRRALAESKSPTALDATRLVLAWLNAGRGLRDACRLACLAPEGPRFSPEDFVETLAWTWVAVPPPARELLAALCKPPEATHTVASLLASFFLDLIAMGRRLRIHIEPAALAADLSAVFDDGGPALAEQLRERSANIEAQLRENAHFLETLLAETGDAARDDTDALAVLRSADAMGPRQQTWVQAMAWRVMTELVRLRGGNPKMAEVLDDAAQGKRLLVRMLAEQPPVLTEDAWEGILAESEAGAIAWRIALVSLRTSELHASQVCRAFLENAELRAYAIGIGRDERAMRELGELAARVRAGRGSETR